MKQHLAFVLQQRDRANRLRSLGFVGSFLSFPLRQYYTHILELLGKAVGHCGPADSDRTLFKTMGTVFNSFAGNLEGIKMGIFYIYKIIY